MNKPTLYKSAVILFALLSVFTVIFFLPGMLNPSVTTDIPPIVGALGVMIGAVGLVAAWGAWKGQKWGIWLAIALCALNGLLALPGVLGAPNNIARVGAIITVAVAIFVIVVFLLNRPITTPTG